MRRPPQLAPTRAVCCYAALRLHDSPPLQEPGVASGIRADGIPHLACATVVTTFLWGAGNAIDPQVLQVVLILPDGQKSIVPDVQHPMPRRERAPAEVLAIGAKDAEVH